MPEYVHEFNGSNSSLDGFQSTLPESWERLPGSLRADDFVGESSKYGRSSGHPVGRGVWPGIGKRVYNSPFLDTASLDLARLVVEHERLGQRGSVDLLAVAFSAYDNIGHLYGPFSVESDDTLKNVDMMLKKLFSCLDETVGEGNYIAVLSSDHGVAELPEWSIENDRFNCPVASGRANQYALGAKMYWHLYRNFTFPFGNPGNLLKKTAPTARVLTLPMLWITE